MLNIQFIEDIIFGFLKYEYLIKKYETLAGIRKGGC